MPRVAKKLTGVLGTGLFGAPYRKETYTDRKKKSSSKEIAPRKTMKPMPITPEMNKKLKNKPTFDITLPKREDRSKRKQMTPLNRGGKVKK